MKDFLVQNPRVAVAILCGVVGAALGAIDFWSFSGVLAATGTLLAGISVGITVMTLNFLALKRNWVAGAFAAASTALGIGSIALKHPSFEECAVETQHTLEHLGQEAHQNPVSYDLNAPQVQLAQDMYLACGVQGARNLATVPGELFQARQEPEISVATRLRNGPANRPASQCLEAYNKLRAAKPSLFKLYENKLTCLRTKPSRLSW